MGLLSTNNLVLRGKTEEIKAALSRMQPIDETRDTPQWESGGVVQH